MRRQELIESCNIAPGYNGKCPIEIAKDARKVVQIWRLNADVLWVIDKASQSPIEVEK